MKQYHFTQTLTNTEVAMKQLKRFFRTVFTLIFSFSLIFALTGCNENASVNGPEAVNVAQQPVDGVTGVSLNKGRGGGGSSQLQYPLVGSKIFSLKRNGTYGSGSITLDNGISFSLGTDALTPPSDIPFGDDVNITVTCERPNTGRNELTIEFGPHGCQFSPRAMVVLDWADLGIDVANLYYINDNGDYVLQNPDQIDIQNKRMYLYLDHFSRYALAAD